MIVQRWLDTIRRVGPGIAGLCLLGSAFVALAAELAVTDSAASSQRSVPALDAASTAKRAKTIHAYARLPLYFEENAGQFDSTVRYGASGHGYQLLLTGSEATLVLKKPTPIPTDPEGPPRSLSRTSDGVTGAANGATPPPTVIRVNFKGANPNPEVVGENSLPGKSHYFTGSDPAKWHTDIPQYGRVRYRGVYPGIDLVYYGSQGRLEYDWIVAPGADPHRIVEAFSGATSLSIDADGDLVINSPDAGIRQKKPVIYQEVDGNRIAVDGQFVLLGDKLVGFKVGRYDATLPLVIDPVLDYSASFEFSRGAGIAASQTGEVYVVGGTADTPNGLAFVTKINATGDAIVYSTKFGGTAPNRFGESAGPTFATKVAVGEDGSAYVLGSTRPQTGFPTTTCFGSCSTNPLADPHGGATFVVKLAPNGAIAYASVFGSTRTQLNGALADTSPGDIAVDSSGSAYINGWTLAPDFPTTSGALQSSNPSTTGQFVQSGFITKLTPAGNALVYSTLFGDGEFQSVFRFQTLAIDSAGSAYAVAITTSPRLPVVNAFQGALVGSANAYFAKLDPAGASLLYASYLGGSRSQFFVSAKADAQGSLFMCGSTNSTNFPLVNPLPIGTILGGSSQTAMVVKVAPSGAVTLSTPLGTSSTCNDLALDPFGNAYITGSADATSFPRVGDLGLGGNGNSAFLSKISADGTSLPFSIMMGGQGGSGTGVATDAMGGTYVVGFASGQFPFTTSLPGGGTSRFLLKVQDSTEPVVVFSSINPAAFGQPVTFTARVTIPNATGNVTFLDGSTVLGTVPLNASRTAALTVPQLSAGSHTITASYGGDANHPAASGSVVQQVNAIALNTVTTLTTSSTNFPANQSVVLTATVTGTNTSAPTGSVAFLDGTATLGVAALTSGVATLTVTIPSGGQRVLTAQYAGDAFNKPSASAPVPVTVIGPPAVSIGAPANLSAFDYPAMVAITVIASPAPGATLVSVDLILNGIQLVSFPAPPYSFSWANAPPGVYQITARAVDNFGQITAVTVQTQIRIPGIAYYHHDLQGNVIASTDGVGQVAYTESYLPYGGRRIGDPASQVAQPNGNRLWFHGKVQDESTGLQYFGARYYDPVIGRFMGVDSVESIENNIHSFNRYAYGNNNPYRYLDPDGRLADKIVFGAIVLGIAAAIVNHTNPQLSARIARELRNIFHNEADNSNETPGPGSEPSSPGRNNSDAKGGGSGCPNPDGCKGKKDHQDKVGELGDRARGEAKEGEQVLENKKIRGHDSNRRPDQQIVDKEGKTRKIYEAERNPGGTRNRTREAEYDRLGIPHETYPLK